MRGFLVCLAGILAFTPPAMSDQVISAEAYLDKLQGMWAGELWGNSAGRMREGVSGNGGIDYTVNWTDPAHIDPTTQANDYVFRYSPWDGDDDTCFEYLYMNMLQGNVDPTAAQITQLWSDHISYPSFYIANRQARWAINSGVQAPNTGSSRRNVYWYSIDSQITTESLGAMAPGMRQRAADLAGRFGSVTNDGFALHAAQYYAAMYSAAASESDVEKLVQMGQQVVPTTSRTWRIIQDVRDWYNQDKTDGNLDWRPTQSLAYSKYCAQSNGRYYGWVESSVNTAMTTLAILYGQGDFQKTVEIGVQAGFDSDCNPATAGGLIGLIQGYSGLPQDFRDRSASAYHASNWLTGINGDSNLPQIAAGFQAAAEAQIFHMGGTIIGQGTSRTYHLPDDVLTAPAEKPDPAGPRGLVGQVRAIGGTVSVSASVQYSNPSDDCRYLDGLIDGIVDVTYNGHRPYSSDDAATQQPGGGDFYQLNFDRQVLFSSLVFYEGDFRLGGINAFPDSNTQPPLGGFFTDLTVEVGNGGLFQAVQNLSLSEALDRYQFYQVITFSFSPTQGDAIRVRGTAGGTLEFTTVVELEAYGALPEPSTACLLCLGAVCLHRRTSVRRGGANRRDAATPTPRAAVA